AEELQHPQRGPSPAPAAITAGDWYERLPARIAAVDAALRKGPLRLAAPIEEERGAGLLRFKHRLYQVQLTDAERGKAEAAIEAVRGADPGLAISTVQSDSDTEVRLGIDGLLVSTVRFMWREHPEARPRLAVVIGPLGDDLRLARHAIEGLDAPVVLGVNPEMPFAAQVAALGKLFEREVVLDYVVAPPPPPLPTPVDPLTPAPSRPRRAPPPALEAALETVPEAIGVAWTGGGVTPPKPDKAMLAAVDGRSLPFLGDRGDKAASLLPPTFILVESAERPEGLDEQLAAVTKAVHKQGRAVVIGAPSDATLGALQAALPQWRAAQIEIVPLSVLLAVPTPAATATPPPTPKLSAR
ncbi:MAG: divergent polysaccharide deacetylase family protein, partial [bacterium]